MAIASRQHQYARPQGVAVLDALLARGQRIFTIQDARLIAEGLRISRGTLSWLLHELVRSGWIVRLRQGLYAVDETYRGGPAPHPFAIAAAVVRPSAISHWSAFAHHGLTEQIPRHVTATTPKSVVTPRMRQGKKRSDGPSGVWEAHGLLIHYIRVRPDRFWGFDEVWVDEFSRVPITDRERTILDAFVAPEIFGSLHEVIGALDEHLAEIDVDRLVAYALKYGQDAAIKRIGYVLERLGIPPNTITPLHEAPISGYRPLDASAPPAGPHVARWHIRDNLRPAGRDG